MTDVRNLFHGTSISFDKFSLDFAVRPDMHGNGALGVWLAVEKELASRYGSRCLGVQASFKSVYPMDISELSGLNRKFVSQNTECPSSEESRRRELAYYQGHRQRLLENGYDAIAVIEKNGNCDMMIALDPDRLSIQGRMLYHVTPEHNLPSILAGGLHPVIGPRSEIAGEVVPSIYCFPNRTEVENALGNWLGDQFDEDEPLVILELLCPVEQREREGAGYEVVVTEPVPPAAILAVYDDSWTARMDKDLDLLKAEFERQQIASFDLDLAL